MREKRCREVVVYARTSMADQNSETQLLAVKDYCARVGYEIKDTYCDNGFSGKNGKRPQFERLLGNVRAKKVDCVVVYKLDRIGRSLSHLLNLFAEFKSRGVEFISTTQNINTKTPEGKMFWQMLGVFAEYEREMIVARTNAGLARAKRQGKSLGRPKGKKDSRPRKISGYINRWANGGK